MSSKYKILWLNGPLQGRELSLPLGCMSIGPDGDVLATLVELSQLDLCIDDAGVHLQSEVSTWIDGKPVGKLDFLPLGRVIEFAGIAMVLGGADDVLRMQAIPKRGQSKSTMSYWMLVIASLLIFTLLMSVLLVPSSPPQTVQTPSQWLSQQLIQDGLKDVRASWSSSGIVTLSGYCTDAQQITGFFSDLKNNGILFVDHTQCGDQLISNVKGVLSQNGFPDAIVELGHELGSVNISGAIRSGEAWDKAVDGFNHLPGLLSWHVSNQVNRQLKPLIVKLREKQLLSGLMVARVKNSIVITGKISEEKQQLVMSVARQLEQSHPSGFKLVFQNIPVRDELAQMLSAPVVSFGGNAKSPFIELSNGMRLSAGSKLENGFMINYMNIHGLDLTRGGELIHIPLIF
ncbi:type III secretion apparatus protein, YscD/HrpQ family [Shewanella psychrophila]|uniref:Type III secretion apparatus protein, YscD/HrpQ family n=1 Tax=Shewanella psychrophila TaxID=225848 RepID=A0A1S6HL14_9GAMM|nr:type III secretion system inner membrane ring subunit SctD [Shewanella psychrophila]AQS36199.1 type III secretion apparatus protein, YscD/HrpQ family [Shewanella psychrophila]